MVSTRLPFDIASVYKDVDHVTYESDHPEHTNTHVLFSARIAIQEWLECTRCDDIAIDGRFVSPIGLAIVALDTIGFASMSARIIYLLVDWLVGIPIIDFLQSSSISIHADSM